MLRAARIFVLIHFLLLLKTTADAQNKGKDSIATRHLDPAKAAIYSACLPGLGQIYNHKIWKAAIVYAGFGGITAGLIYNQRQLNNYQQAVNVRFDTSVATMDTRYPDLSDGTVVSLRNYHRRNRDICILALAGLYALNIIDASVDANLQEFSINRDLSLRWEPYIIPSVTPRTPAGLHLTLTF